MADSRISGVKDPRYARARDLLATGRLEDGRWVFVVEGEVSVRRALSAPVAVESVFVRETKGSPASPDVEGACSKVGISVLRVPEGLFFKLVGTTYRTSVPCLAVVSKEPFPLSGASSVRGPVVVADSLQDPMNVGVLVRTADALGAGFLVFTAGCTDPFSRRAVRSSTGSILSLPCARAGEALSVAERLREAGFRIVATSASGGTPLASCDLSGRIALFLGNETEGLGKAFRERADVDAAIPMAGSAHSLNVAVAAGVLLHEIARSR